MAYFSEGARLPRGQWDEETGNFYYGARYYDPKISVWLSVDPLAHEYYDSSPYVFVANNPLILIDPDGMKWINAHDGELEEAQANYDSKKTKLGRWFAGLLLTWVKAKWDRANNAIEEIRINNEGLYNYIENLTVADYKGNPMNVNVYVHSDGLSEGPGGAKQKGDTRYRKVEAGHPIVYYKGKPIAMPCRASKPNEIGFDINLYGAESFMDITLANEVGDIMFFMEYNPEAIEGGGNQKYYEPGGGGYDEYLKSESAKYSFKVQEIYKESKKQKEINSKWPVEK